MLPACRRLLRPSLCRRLLSSSSAPGHPSPVEADAEAALGLPSIPMAEYQARRERLLRAVGSLPDMGEFQRHVFVLPAAMVKYMAFHVPYVFHQDSYFRYLCGFPEPGAALLLSIDAHNETLVSHLFVEQRAGAQVVWDGPTIGLDGARAFLTDRMHEVGEFEAVLRSELADCASTAVWFAHDRPLNTHLRDQVLPLLEAARPPALFDPSSVLDLLRLVKSPAELRAMRAAAQVGGRAIAETMRYCAAGSADGMSEFKLWAKVDFESRARGCLLAYPPVVGGGENANIIHYLRNGDPVRPGQLVLMDAGSQCDGYVSDITRTWPVDGRFTDAQRTVYEIVLRVLDTCIDMVSPETSLNRLYHHMLTQLSQEFKAAGVIRQSCRWENDSELGRQICPHHIGHWLGLDVHDTPSVSTTLGLMRGVVFPLEPGAYFPASCHFVEPEFRGMGIRVEDDLAMTEAGVEVLSRDCPRTPDEIEAAMRPRPDQ